MGLISSLQAFVTKNVSAETRAKVVSAADSALTVLTSPIAAIKNFSKAKEETSKKSTVKLLAEGVENTLLVTAPFSAAGKSLAAKAVSTAFGSVKNTAITLTAAGAVAASPTVRNTAITAVTPSTYIGAGEKVGNVIEGLSSDKGKDFGSKAVVAAATGLGVAGLAVAGYELYKDYKEDKAANTTLPTDTNVPSTSLTPTIATNQSTPVVPATTTVTTGTTSVGGKTKRKKYKKKREVPYINIKIDNREDNDVNDRKVYKGGRF